MWWRPRTLASSARTRSWATRTTSTPRSQIGYPETLGGVLRNANQDFRSEPLNPRDPVSIFNLSTIPPDVMRPKFEIDYDYK